MRIDESVSKLEGLEKGFDQCANDLSNIFLSLGLTSSVEAPKDAPQVVKYAASALIVNEMETLMREASEPDGIQVVIQLGKRKHWFGERLRLAMPGGALLSNQELDWIEDPANAGITTPSNLFYRIAKLQLLETNSDGLRFDYDFERAGTGFTQSIRTNLLRELSEEISVAAVNRIELEKILDGESRTTIHTMDFGDREAAKVIAARFHNRGVTACEDGTLKGIFTHVTERVAVASGPIHDLPKLAVENSEAAGIRIMDLGSILEASKKTSGSAEAWKDYRQHFPQDNYADGIRNPSLPWGLARLVSWIKDQVLESDTYREGPRLRGTDERPAL